MMREQKAKTTEESLEELVALVKEIRDIVLEEHMAQYHRRPLWRRLTGAPRSDNGTARAE